MDTIKLVFTGESPMLMHSDRGANPLDKDAKELRTFTKKRGKTDEDHETIARLEWHLGLYHDAKLGPYIPAQMIQATIINGGKLVKLGTAIERAVMVVDDRVKLLYTGPRTTKELWEAKSFADTRSVVVGQARTMRCRPVFENWSLSFELMFDTSVLNSEQVVQCAENGGRLIGLGDYRPRFGRFSVKQAKA